MVGQTPACRRFNSDREEEGGLALTGNDTEMLKIPCLTHRTEVMTAALGRRARGGVQLATGNRAR